MLTKADVPPDRVRARKLRRLTNYLFDRSLEVVLHYGREVVVKYGSSNGSPISEHTARQQFKWNHLLEVWHGAWAQLFADGVPRERILPGGLLRVSSWLSTYGLGPVHSSHLAPLARWKYEEVTDTPLMPHPTTRYMVSAASGIQGDDKVPENLSSAAQGPSEAISDESFEWPSSTIQLTGIRATKEMEALMMNSPRLVNRNELDFTVSNQPSPCETAQHYPSTFRILTYRMRDLHNNLFDGESEYSGDDEFWQQLFIDLDKSWKIYDIVGLKSRFEWLIKFIRTGDLPSEAQAADEILREALNDNVLSHQTHPYNHTSEHSVGSFLNPDLSLEWVQSQLSSNNALLTVKQGITNPMPDAGIRGFCNMYGILVARLWEERSLQVCQDRPGFSFIENTLCSPEELASNEDISQISSCSGVTVCNSAPQAQGGSSFATVEKQHLEGLEQVPHTTNARVAEAMEEQSEQNHSAKSMKPTARHSDSDSSPKKERIKKQLPNSNWSSDETEYMQNPLFGTTCPTVKEEMQKSFPAIDLVAVRGVAKQQLSEASQMNEPKSQGWTAEEDDYVRSLSQGDKSVVQQFNEFAKEFGPGRSKTSFHRRRRKMGLTGKIRKLAEQFSREESDFLWDMVLKRARLSEIIAGFFKRFGTSQLYRSIQNKVRLFEKQRKRGLTPQRAARIPWTTAEEQFLRDRLHLRGDILRSEFYAHFDSSRTDVAYTNKVKMMRAKERFQHGTKTS